MIECGNYHTIPQITVEHLSSKVPIENVYKSPSWFWGISSIWFSLQDVDFSTVVSVEEKGVEVDISTENSSLEYMSLNYIIFESTLPIVTDSTIFTSSSTFKFVFPKRLFSAAPRVVVSIQSVTSSRFLGVEIGVVETTKDFCTISAKMDESCTQSIQVGVFAYDERFLPEHVTQEMGHEPFDAEKAIQITSQSIEKSDSSTKRKVEDFLLKNYYNIPSLASFLVKFQASKSEHITIDNSLFFLDSKSYRMCVGTQEEVRYNFVVCGNLQKPTHMDFYRRKEQLQNNGIGTLKKDEMKVQNIRCVDVTDEKKQCGVCKKHLINTIFSCGHACLCYCCAQKLEVQPQCPYCGAYSIRPLLFKEVV
ncbi:hypothetical protein EIN_111910 [Entamoeba invadens IP1]|uniref:RING-type domain-containing protein n=1 Tax=Entamoeba invadens IP1 TaxID=370355 RepID=A0A0A1TXX5_ENTIV|nr:hypothetical protein EIN_111910 [Entamoeba invadens IP1]ELP86237.1 hypothetical protein EIN_111910 [Entamoeba invadens IP1]|eukprot:XP_004185583.1 hypothetical protein EIN_111910 [Entamoeba invadens IP1]